MNKRILSLVGTMALAASALAWWFGAQGESVSSKKSSSARARASLGESHQEDDRSGAERSGRASEGSERRRARLGAVNQSPSTAPSAATPPEPATAVSGSTPDGRADEEGSASTEEMLANLDATFEMEPSDRSWSTRTVSDIYDVVQPVLGRNSEIRSVECKTSLCRIESVQEDSDHYASFVTKLKRSKVSPEGFYTQTGATPDGRPILTMYLTRPGHPMPRLN